MPPTDVLRLLCDYAAGDLSPVEAVRCCLHAIERAPRLNAFRLVDADAALAQARAAEDRWRASTPCGRLDGVPVAVKDTLDVAGWSTWYGSLTTDRKPVGQDAPAVQRLRAEGAVFLGKTTTPEFGWTVVTNSPATGVTRNPHDDSRTSGGSSGGSAVAVASGMSLLALGTDGGGSVRIPASFTGTVGFKPSHGRVPVSPPSVLPELAHVGPLARNVADAARMLDVLAGPHPLDWTAAPPPLRYASIVNDGVAGLRVALVTAAPDCPTEPDVVDAVVRAGHVLEEYGAHVTAVEPPFTDAGSAFDALWFAGMAHRIDRVPAELRHLVDEGLRHRAERARATSSADLFDAVSTMMAVRQAMGMFHSEFDLLVAPTAPVTAFVAERSGPPGMNGESWTSWTPFTYPFNLTHQPALSIPFARSDNRLPVGVQVVAGKHRDDLVIRAGQVLESAADVLDVAGTHV